MSTAEIGEIINPFVASAMNFGLITSKRSETYNTCNCGNRLVQENLFSRDVECFECEELNHKQINKEDLNV